MRFFFDRCMSPRLARMIDIFDQEHSVRHHDEDPRFDRTTPDAVWIATLGADDPPWIIISGDNRILRNKAERQVLREANLTFFCMSKPWTHMLIHEYAWKFLKVWPDLASTAAISTAGSQIFEVGAGHSLKIELRGRTRD